MDEADTDVKRKVDAAVEVVADTEEAKVPEFFTAEDIN